MNVSAEPSHDRFSRVFSACRGHSILAFLSASVAAAAFAAEVVVLNDDGAWNWLQDERALAIGDRVIVASVASGRNDPARAGNIEVASHNLRTRQTSRFTLRRETDPERQRRWRDDHSCPALVQRPDGRILALYSRHGQEENFYYRISTAPGDATAWGEERTFALAVGSRVTFPNLVHLSAENGGKGRLLLWFRGLHNRMMPSLAHSDDAGETWQADDVWQMQLPPRTTPYAKFVGANDGATLHLAFASGHRVNFGNAVFHAQYRDGRLWRSDGGLLGTLAEASSASPPATEIFRANADSVAMIGDLALDAQGHPRVVYSVQLDTRRARPRPIGADHRYRYARWTGREWLDVEMARAGTEVHAAADDDCTGLAALDPQNPSLVYISTNVDPASGAALISKTDGKRHWEIFQGTTVDGGASWVWTPITRDSRADNLRPIVPPGADGPSPVLWLRGEMRMPQDYTLAVVGWIRGVEEKEF